MASLRINHPSLLYAEGLILTLVIGGLGAAVGTVAERLMGWTLQTGAADGWVFAASYLLCLAGALAMKKPLECTIVLIIPLMVGLGAAVEVIAWTPRTGPGIGWVFVASYLLCLAGALALKKPLGRTIILMLVPLAVIPLEVLLLGALLLWLFGFPSGIQ